VMQLAKEKIQSVLIGWLRQYNPADVKKGFRIYNKAFVEIDVFNEKTNTYFITVSSESDEDTTYDVEISLSQHVVEDECDCPAYEKTSSCKHIVAAIVEILYSETDLDTDEIEQLMKKEPVQMLPTTTGKVIPLINDGETSMAWHSFVAEPYNAFLQVQGIFGYHHSRQGVEKVKLLAENNEEVSWNFQFKASAKAIYSPEIKYDRVKKFGYRCTCKERTIMCTHVKAAFDWLYNKYDRNYFARFKDYTKEKAELLEEYGLTLQDKEAQQIEFFTDYYGKLQMKVPTWLWGRNAEKNITTFKKTLTPKKDAHIFAERPIISKDSIIDFEVGFLFNFLSMHFKSGFELETVKVFNKSSGEHFKKLSIHNAANLPLLKELPDDIYDLVLGLTDEGVKNYLLKNGHGYIGNYANAWNNASDDTIKLLRTYYMEQLQKLWPYLCGHSLIYQLKQGTFSNKNIKPAKLSAEPVTISFLIEEDERFITIRKRLLKNQAVIDAKSIQNYAAGIFIIDDVLHLPAHLDDMDILNQFQHGFIKMPVSNKLALITGIIPALQKKYNVQLPASLQIKTIEATPKPQILLKEFNTQYLMLQPQFVYEEQTVDYDTDPKDILQTLPDGSWQVIQRDAAKEKSFFENIRLLHHQFQRQKQNNFFYLPFDDVMKQNWFINTVRQLLENDVPVSGMQELKKFRYNTNKPKWEMKAGSGIDWFDLRIAVSFGDQVVPLKEVRKALLSKQNIVLLGDGTIGVLPEEWLQQYGLILKIGNEQKDGTLRLSKLHYTLIDELHSQISDEQVLQEINEKKHKLQNIENVKTVKISSRINAVLRPYQQGGFQWMQTLDELGWGGCLADDMGLGKTLQALTFLQFLKEKYAGSTHLVVCPTSLIYNWENELKKFAPSLNYHIYYGSAREFSDEHFQDYDIVITSYGIIRNDLEQLLQFNWHYVILDESQSIKNPDALTTKAVQLLKSKNRLILSGTPVQNNTYDLYAQFNFINPGLLGNREFYKEFANGIDKYNDAEKAAQLRRLVYPFMLRRTKEQVAPDLPDKTEMVLWCEMDKEQRAVYDDYKNHYRTTLLKKIEEVGLAKAGIYVLEGLLRLRQICDSPQLVKNEEIKTIKSVKIDELMREVQENTGQHKLLVFSQFTEMLQLIKERMEQEGLQYAYLDGSTSAKNRKKAVDDFQTDPAIKIFLISLKAGGVGLNLTAADYIYLVDPWWNPAVEQQAIDRTHRIGQLNKIFAYRMICKNTIEEKIIELQQRKKQIANELVTEDAGFIKKLSKDDIAFLFN